MGLGAKEAKHREEEEEDGEQTRRRGETHFRRQTDGLTHSKVASDETENDYSEEGQPGTLSSSADMPSNISFVGGASLCNPSFANVHPWGNCTRHQMGAASISSS